MLASTVSLAVPPISVGGLCVVRTHDFPGVEPPRFCTIICSAISALHRRGATQRPIAATGRPIAVRRFSAIFMCGPEGHLALLVVVLVVRPT